MNQFTVSDFTSDAHTSTSPYKGKVKLFPTEVLSFRKYQDETKKVYFYLRKAGWDAKVSTSSKTLDLWIEWLQINTKLYDYIPIKSRCLLRGDYFHGNLLLGPSFTEWLKKARHYTMQYNIALDDTSIPDEYVVEGWAGYDSFLPETSLIHWEEEINDFPWSFIKLRYQIDENYNIHLFKSMLEKFGPKNLHLSGTYDFLRLIKASKFFDPVTGKSRFMRDFIPSVDRPHEGWIGKRVKIQALPGGGRDGTMATPSTLIKIKLSAEIFLKICQTHPNSAMCDNLTQTKRIQKLRSRGKVFLHWDFKKVGLTADRRYFICLAKAVQSVYGIDMSWFDFDELVIFDEDRAYKPSRGYALGWMNEGITLVIIRWIAEFLQLKKLDKLVDFLVFNDDVEIALLWEASRHEMFILKSSLLEFFKEKDIPCSIKKIFFSHASIFLEDYFDPYDEYDFEKRSVATRIYSKAMITSLPFMRKSYLSIASQLWKEQDIIDLIISKTKKEFKGFSFEEILPFESGGFFYSFKDGLNQALIERPIYTLYSYFMSTHVKVDLKVPEFKSFSWYSSKKAEERLVNEAQSHYWSQVPQEDIDECFTFDLAASIETRLMELPESSRLKFFIAGQEPPPDEYELPPAGIG